MQFNHYLNATEDAKRAFLRNVIEAGRDHAAWRDENRLLDSIELFTEFCERANDKRFEGFKTFAARTIVEHIRFSTPIKDSCNLFKINDHITPDLARLAMLAFPERFDGFFNTRNGSRKVVMSGEAA